MPHENESAVSGRSPVTLSFDYEKGNFFRVIHVDGAHGGVSPDGNYIIMNVFNERRPIPKRETMNVNAQGHAEPSGKPQVRAADVYREVEASLVMDEPTAQAIMEWLGKHLGTFRDLQRKKTETMHPSRTKIDPGP